MLIISKIGSKNKFATIKIYPFFINFEKKKSRHWKYKLNVEYMRNEHLEKKIMQS